MKDVNIRIEELTSQMKVLEEQLEEELKKNHKELFYKIEHGKAVFQEDILKEGKAKMVSSIKYLSSFPILAILTIPIIWSMMIPIFIADIFVTIYQYTCFPIYKIPIVKRKEYVIMDRHTLFYLDNVEKINCWYCEYFNGVIAYIKEVAARTEQYWCPIKHAKPLKEQHSRYENFFDYGDYKQYSKELKSRRSDFKDIESKNEEKHY